MMRATVRDVGRHQFRMFTSQGTLVEYPLGAGGVPMPVARVFTISAVPAGTTRANHAHLDCSQLLTCVQGELQVVVHDGSASITATLAPDGRCIIVPPLLWVKVDFLKADSSLLVFCDRAYEEADYIRDWGEFLAIRAAPNTSHP